MKNVSSFLGLALLAASVPLAHAGLEINYSINGGRHSRRVVWEEPALTRQ